MDLSSVLSIHKIFMLIREFFFFFPNVKVELPRTPYIGSIGDSPIQEPIENSQYYDGIKRIQIWQASWRLKITTKSEKAIYFDDLIIPNISNYFRPDTLNKPPKNTIISPTQPINRSIVGYERINSSTTPPAETFYNSLKGLKVIIIYTDQNERKFYTVFSFSNQNKHHLRKPKELKNRVY